MRRQVCVGPGDLIWPKVNGCYFQANPVLAYVGNSYIIAIVKAHPDIQEKH